MAELRRRRRRRRSRRRSEQKVSSCEENLKSKDFTRFTRVTPLLMKAQGWSYIACLSVHRSALRFSIFR
jgi:hypothetical protein